MSKTRSKKLMESLGPGYQLMDNFLRNMGMLSKEELTKVADMVEFELWERAQLEDYENLYGVENDQDE